MCNQVDANEIGCCDGGYVNEEEKNIPIGEKCCECDQCPGDENCFCETKEEYKLPVNIVLSEGAKIPTYQTSGSAGADLSALNDYVVEAGKTVLVKTGLFMEIPDGCALFVCSRSGLALKQNVFVLNAPGIVDCDYRGEIGVILCNMSNNNFTIAKGDRIAQAVFVPYIQGSFNVVDKLNETVRGEGGFNSTGVK